MAQQLLKDNYCKSLIVGRGCLINPYLFLETKKLLGQQIDQPRLIDVVERYIEITEKNVDYGNRNIKRANIFHWFSMPFEDTDEFKNIIFDLKHNTIALQQYTR